MTAEFVEELKKATSINFSGNSYSLESCKALAQLIKANKAETLDSVDVSDCFTQRSKVHL
jgi:Ran GTPase-activating protein (RanGAP) involved in mRNA processing and transport